MSIYTALPADGGSEDRDVIPPPPHAPRGLLLIMLFGAIVGVPLGGLFGAASYSIAGRGALLWQGALVGALLGIFGGAAIGLIERQVRGGLVRSEAATIVGGTFGFVPALLFIAGLQLAGGISAIRVFVGIALIGPTVGILIGAVFDRALEAGHNHFWGATVRCSVFGLAACVGLVFLIERMNQGPDPEEVADRVKSAILQEWNHSHAMKSATIQRVTVERKGNNAYAGVVEATMDNNTLRFRLDVTMVGKDAMSWQLEPIENE